MLSPTDCDSESLQPFRVAQCLDTPLHKAAGWGSAAVVALLLETPGVDPEVMNAVSRSV